MIQHLRYRYSWKSCACPPGKEYPHTLEMTRYEKIPLKYSLEIKCIRYKGYSLYFSHISFWFCHCALTKRIKSNKAWVEDLTCQLLTNKTIFFLKKKELIFITFIEVVNIKKIYICLLSHGCHTSILVLQDLPHQCVCITSNLYPEPARWSFLTWARSRWVV